MLKLITGYQLVTILINLVYISTCELDFKMPKFYCRHVGFYIIKSSLFLRRMIAILLLLIFLRLNFLGNAFISPLNRAAGLKSSQLRDISEKLVFDEKSGRMYEQDIDERLDDAFCLTDETTGKSILLTKEEKERIFLDAIQSYYFKGESGIKDEEFDALRDDLSWEGSVLVSLNRDETKFVNAISAYKKGKLNAW